MTALMARADLGGDAWWADVAASGTPLLEAGTGPDGAIDVVFLWRQQGCETQVYIDVWSHTPHPAQGPTALMKIAGTDVWQWRTRLPADWRGSYFLVPAGQADGAPDTGERRAMRHWWIALMARAATADPLNRLPPHGGAWGVRLSALLLPDAPVHPAWRAARDVPPQGRLLEVRWASALLDTVRPVWVYRSGALQNCRNSGNSGNSGDTADTADLPLAILLDGQYWARQMPLFSALDVLTAAGDLPPAVYLLIDAISPERRAHELPCHAPFWRAVHEELLPQVMTQVMPDRLPGLTVVAGQSYGGLAALYAALHWPQRYQGVLSQSGSFWWPDAESVNGWLAGQVGAGHLRAPSLNIVLQAGCYEDDMLETSRVMAAALRDTGHRVAYYEVRGGHDWLCWRDGLLDGLCRLLGPGPRGQQCNERTTTTIDK